jgi:hypothetical protein
MALGGDGATGSQMAELQHRNAKPPLICPAKLDALLDQAGPVLGASCHQGTSAR